jgi:hypothetical protein
MTTYSPIEVTTLDYTIEAAQPSLILATSKVHFEPVDIPFTLEDECSADGMDLLALLLAQTPEGKKDIKSKPDNTSLALRREPEVSIQTQPVQEEELVFCWQTGRAVPKSQKMNSGNPNISLSLYV